MVSKFQLQKGNSIILEEEVQVIQKKIEILNYKINNYEKVFQDFKNNLKKLIVLFEDFHNFFNKNFKFVDEEKTKLVFMKKKIKRLVYHKVNKEIFFQKISSFESFHNKTFHEFEEFYEDRHNPEESNFAIYKGDNSPERYVIFGNIFPFGEIDDSVDHWHISTAAHVLNTTNTYIKKEHLGEKDYWVKEDFTEETMNFFEQIQNKGRLYLEFGYFYVLSKNDLEEKIKGQLDYHTKELRKRELILRARKKGREKTENVGYVYALSNEAYPNTYKIGSTYGLPEERAEDLTGTGHLIPFKVVAKIKVQSAEYYEKSIHKLLIDYRVKESREFFKLDLKKIEDCFKQVSELSDKGKEKLTSSDLKKRIKI